LWLSLLCDLKLTDSLKYSCGTKQQVATYIADRPNSRIEHEKTFAISIPSQRPQFAKHSTVPSPGTLI
jgi:hypothetical protein